MKYNPDEMTITPEESRRIADIREELELMGHDVSNLSDIEIKAGVLNLSHIVIKLGVTVKQATEAMMQIAKASTMKDKNDE